MRRFLVAALVPALCLLAACGPAGESASMPSSAVERAQPQQPIEEAPTQQQAQPAATRMPTPEALTDAAITGRIGAALQSDPAMRGADVSVNTDNGVVVLSGTVRSHEQSGVASAHAQRQDGVLRVENNLRPQYS
jgi:osmotically-inducible protein OsmY